MSLIAIMYLMLAIVLVALIFGATGIYLMAALVAVYWVQKEFGRRNDEKLINGEPGTVPDANILYKNLWESMPYHRAAAIAGSHGEIASRSRGYSEMINYLWCDSGGHYVYASFRNGKLEFWSFS